MTTPTAVRVQVHDAVRGQLRTPVWNRVHATVHGQVRATVWTQVNAVWTQVENAVRAQVYEAIAWTEEVPPSAYAPLVET